MGESAANCHYPLGSCGLTVFFCFVIVTFYFFLLLCSATSTQCLLPGDSGKNLKAWFLGLIDNAQKSHFILCAELIDLHEKQNFRAGFINTVAHPNEITSLDLKWHDASCINVIFILTVSINWGHY